MQSLVTDSYTLRVDKIDASEAPVLRVAWLGRADQRRPGTVLHPFFDALLDEAAGIGAAIELRFEPLEHFNSATIAVLMQFIRSAGGRRVPVRIRFDPAKKWQKLTFDVLRRFEDPGGLLEVRSLGASEPREANE